MAKNQKIVVLRAMVSGILLICAYLLGKWYWLSLALFGAAYVIIGYDVLRKSYRNILRGQVFDENFLMSIATIGALALQEFGEAVFVMLFYQVGELFQSIAVGKSRKSISSLLEMAPEFANVEKDGELVRIDPSELGIGDVIVIKPGEKIPVDGVVLEGCSSIDTANLTGEAVPCDAGPGSEVISGCINISGALKVRVEKEFLDSTVSKILDLVENASSNKSVSENFITKFARYYTPAVVFAAAITAIVPPLIAGGWSEWLHRALMFLVISCPCALVISVPLSFFGGIGCASQNGILIKGSNFIEALSKCGIAVFDKTGTLTNGEFSVAKISSNGIAEEELLEIAAYAEYYSNHPIARSVVSAYGMSIAESRISDLSEIPGKGVVLKLDGAEVLAGNAALLREAGISFSDKIHNNGTAVYIAGNGAFLGTIVISDAIKQNAEFAMQDIRKCGVETVVMLSGDKRAAAERIGAKLGIDRVYSELLPTEKVSKLEDLMTEKTGKKCVVYIGDGVNDAPVLSRADVGIAMGAFGSDAAIEAADIVLMDDDITKVSLAIRISRNTMRIVKQNISFALFVKFAVMVLGVLGLSNMWEAVFADVGVSVIAILNSMRALKYKTK